MTLDVLILYWNIKFDKRQNITDHLRSFERYVPGNRFYYLDASRPEFIAKAVRDYKFDAVIIHYTLLALRFADWNTAPLIELLRQLSGVKVLIPHDEYYATATLWEIIKEGSIDLIYASCPAEDYNVIYPRKQIGEKPRIQTVLTGYVEESLLGFCQEIAAPISERPIDIGYHHSAMSYMFGKHGFLKTQVGEVFVEALKQPEYSDIVFNIGKTTDVYKYQGKKWLQFLASCKTVLGCLGGSSLHDPYKEIAECTLKYIKEQDSIEYEKVQKYCYKNEDGKIHAFLLGPRHFEAAMTKTCQALVEGDYCGVFRPNKDYIEIKRDFSNIDQVLEKIRDTEYCQNIADQCYEHVVASGEYTYREFANGIMADVGAMVADKSQNSKQRYNQMRFGQAIGGFGRRVLVPIRFAKTIPRRVFYKLTDWFSKIFPKTYEKVRSRFFPNRARDTYKDYFKQDNSKK